MESYSLDPLTAEVAKLSHHGRVLFGLFCSERIFPNYVAFSRKFRFGSPAAIRAALDFAWSTMKRVQAVPSALASAIETNTPDTEKFDTIYVSSALDVCVAVSSLLDLLVEDKANIAVEIAALARDTVDMYVQERENMPPINSDLERQIAEHPLMQQELQNQRLAVEFLLSADLSSATVMSDIRKRWREVQVSNIGIDSDAGIQDDL